MPQLQQLQSPHLLLTANQSICPPLFQPPLRQKVSPPPLAVGVAGGEVVAEAGAELLQQLPRARARRPTQK